MRQVTVPATIIRSAWRGEGRNASMPKRDISNRDMALAIISKAQHASPKVSGQTADFLPQLRSASTDVTARLRWSSSGTSITGLAIGRVWEVFSSLIACPSASVELPSGLVQRDRLHALHVPLYPHWKSPFRQA